jgi:hypothetical protein
MVFANQANAQLGYQKDSLQIKVYTEIEYVQYKTKSIKVKKVFCDYCTKLQSEKIKEEAMRIGYMVRNDKENILNNGIKKLAMYIRVSKKDFAALRENEPEN